MNKLRRIRPLVILDLVSFGPTASAHCHLLCPRGNGDAATGVDDRQHNFRVLIFSVSRIFA
jgi:hypothetical protein